GSRVETLVGAARAALSAASPGQVQAATELDHVLTFGERSAIVADPATVQIFRLLRRLASSDLPVLISGETGVGKENAAYALHAGSARAAESFFALNCGALNQELAESELFGHERGAFTGASAPKIGLFQVAQRGTLFLDEIGELPLAIQAKL